MSKEASTSAPPMEGQRLAVFVVAVMLVVLGSRTELFTRFALPTALGAIVVAIWHGAFDGVLAEEVLRPRWGRHWRPWFFAAYLGLAAVVALCWWLAPVAALGAFLVYSAVHFGTEGETAMTPWRVLGGMATGFVPIAASCHWWPGTTAGIFTEMLHGNDVAAAHITAVCAMALWPATALALTRVPAEGLAAAGLLATELVLFRIGSPLVAFAVFFCLWHTPEHMVSTSLDRAGAFQWQRLRHHLWAGALPWLVSLTAVGVLCWMGRHTVQGYAGALFVLLSALTVPHMLLAEVCRRGEQRAAAHPRGAEWLSERAVSRP